MLEDIKSDIQIRTLLNQVGVILRVLKATGLEIKDTFSNYVTYIVSKLLDFRTSQDQENLITTSSQYPNFNHLQVFLQNRTFATEDRAENKATEEKPVTKNTNTPTK